MLLLITLAISFTRNRGTKVEVVRPQVRQLAEVIALSGRVRGVQESQLAPEISGTIRALLVDEGDQVKAGQVLAELDSGRLEAQLAQAGERVRVAQAQLAVAGRGPLPSQLEEVRAQTRSQQLAAQAAVESAQQGLLEARRGPRIEQIAQAKAVLEETRAEAEQRKREAQRQAQLFSEGAVSKQDYEQAQTLATRATAAGKSAEQALIELERGTRPEQIEQARQALLSAQADLLAAQDAGEARVQQLLDQPRPEDLEVARTQIEEAQSAVVIAREQLAQSKVTAPYQGTVGRRLLRVGDLAGPSAPIFTFSSRPSLEIRIDVDESDRARLALGLKAKIRASGYSQELEAEVKELAPEVDPVRGTIEVRLQPLSPPTWLVPGQTVDVNLIMTESEERLVLPLTCVILKGEKSEVVVVEDGVAAFREVEISNPTQEGYLIRSGLEKEAQVVLYPQGIREGDSLRVDLLQESP